MPVQTTFQGEIIIAGVDAITLAMTIVATVATMLSIASDFEELGLAYTRTAIGNRSTSKVPVGCFHLSTGC